MPKAPDGFPNRDHWDTTFISAPGELDALKRDCDRFSANGKSKWRITREDKTVVHEGGIEVDENGEEVDL